MCRIMKIISTSDFFHYFLIIFCISVYDLMAFDVVASVGSAEYTEEPETKVKFQKSLSLPGCSLSLSLLGTGQFLYCQLRFLHHSIMFLSILSLIFAPTG